MADAKIVIIGGAADDQDHDIPDNTDPAWRVHQGATDYIAVDTSEGEEAGKLVSSGMDGGVVLGTAALLKLSPDEGAPMKSLQISTPSREGPDHYPAMVRFTQEDKGEGQNSGGWVGLTHQNVLQLGGDCNVYINSPNRNTGILVENVKTAIYEHAELRSSLSVANLSTPGTSSVAIGEDCTAAGANAISIGYNNIASNTKSLALGNGANSSSSGAVAIGPSCQGAATNSVAIGTNSAKTEGAFSMAMGYFTQTKRPFEQTFTSATYGEDKKASSQRKFVSGKCQTTDGTVTTMLDAENDGSAEMFVNTTNCQTLNRSSTSFFNVKVISTVGNQLGQLNSSTISSTTVTLLRKRDILNFTDGMDVVFSSDFAATADKVTKTISNLSSYDPEVPSTFDVSNTTGISPSYYCSEETSTNFAMGDFLFREYNFAIRWGFDATTPTISIYNGIGTPLSLTLSVTGSLFDYRENVRASNSTIGDETGGIIDSIKLIADSDQPGRGAWQFRVQSAATSARIVHSCFVDQVDHILINSPTC